MDEVLFHRCEKYARNTGLEELLHILFCIVPNILLVHDIFCLLFSSMSTATACGSSAHRGKSHCSEFSLVSIFNKKTFSFIHIFPFTLQMPCSLENVCGSRCPSRFTSFTSVFAESLLSLFALGTNVLYNALTFLHSAFCTLCPINHLVSRSAKTFYPPSMCSMVSANLAKCITQRGTFASTHLGALRRSAI